jgi:hypothetical protein
MKTQKRGKFNLGSKSENTNREASLKQQLAGIIILEKFKDKIILRNLLSILLVIFILGLIAAPSLILIYNSNPLSEAIFFNSTENSNATGVRLSVPVLFMDFNSQPENGVLNSEAVGGTVTYFYNSTLNTLYKIHTFTSNNTFNTTTNLYVETLVVAGGGGGGWYAGGGGGAGGLVYNSSYYVPLGGYNITIGAGGSGATSQVIGGYGRNSSFYTIQALGGGGGGSIDTDISVRGGSGGGSGGSSSFIRTRGLGYSGQGNAGGWNHIQPSMAPAGGGGGAGANGTNGTLNLGGTGGVGLAYAISGTLTFYAGGGGGGSASPPPGSGGSGGGGAGSNTTTGTSGTANRGGGGGGGGPSASGGNGSSGIIILRYTLGNHVRDNSLYGHYGILGNSSGGTQPTYNSTGGYDGNGAYIFDGVDDYINISNSNELNLQGKLTLSAWIKTGSSATTRIINKQNQTGNTDVYLLANVGGKLYGRINQAGSITGSTFINDSNWHLLVFTYDGNYLNAYLDGRIDATPVAYNSNPLSSSGALYIGAFNGGSMTNFWNGSIDQVQIWNRALSADEVLNLYNGTRNNSAYIGKYSSSGDLKSLVFYNSTPAYWNTTFSIADTYSSSTGIVYNKNEINLSHPNLFSYWKFDGDYNDALGKNNGTCSSGSCPNNATGISSAAMRFDGINDYIINSSNLLNSPIYSLSLWIKPHAVITTSSSAQVPIALGLNSNGNYLGLGSVTVSCANEVLTIAEGNSSTGYRTCYNASSTPTINSIDTNWHFLNLNWNGSLYLLTLDGVVYNNPSFGASNGHARLMNITQFNIGSSGTPNAFFNGSIDEVLIYNTSLTATEVQQLYKSGLSQHADANITLQTRVASNYNITDRNLVGLWGLNGNGNDELGKNNCTISATLNLNGTVGQAYSFDGNDDSVNCTDASFYNGISNISYSFWVKRNNQGTVITRGSPHNDAGVIIYTGGATIRFYANSAGGGSNYGQFDIGIGNITNFTWTHVAISVNLGNENGTFWINGVNFSGAKSEFGTGLPSSIGDTSDLTFFGNRPNLADDYNGSIDEIRIYNRTLTQAEVLDLYNLGASHINWSNNGNWSSEQTCYDDKTQILTENGWKLFSELDKTEKVATLNPKTNKIEYNLPSEYQIYDSPEFMYKIQTASGELVVSPEHKLYSKIESKKIPGVIIGILLVILGIFILILKLRRKIT